MTITVQKNGNDYLLNGCLPHPQAADAVFGNTCRVHQPRMNGKGARGSGQVATVATPIDERLVDGNLAIEVVHIVIRLAAFRQDHALAGTGSGTAHTVGMRRVGIGAADYPHE